MTEKPANETTPTNEISASPFDTHVVVHTETFDIAEEALGTDVGPGYWKDWRFIGLVVALCLGVNSANLGYTLSANSLSLINADIGPSKNLLWVALAYTLSISASFLLIGRLSDIFGRRWFFIIGNAFALLGCIIGGTASTIDVIIGANVFNGIQAGVGLTFAVAIGELVPNKHRPLWAGAIFGSALPMIGFAPVIARAFGTKTAAGWRWCFYLGIIVSSIDVLLLYICYHPPTFHLLHIHRSPWQQFKRMDFFGLVLYLAGLILFLTALNWGGSQYPWNSVRVICTLIIGGIVLIAFVVYDIYHKGDPLLPIHLFKIRGFGAIIISASVGSCVYYSMVVLWPEQISYLFGGSAVHQGWLACVLGTGIEAGQFMGGIILHFIPYQRGVLVATCCSLTAFAGAMIALKPGSDALGCGLMFMACFCVGVLECVAVVLAPLNCPAEDLGAAMGVLGSIRSTAATCATAIYSAILTNKLKTITPVRVTTAALNAGLPSSSLAVILESIPNANYSDVPGITTAVEIAVGRAISESAAESFRYVWYTVVAFGVIAIIASLLTTDYNQFLTEDVARKMQGTKPSRHNKAYEDKQHV